MRHFTSTQDWTVGELQALFDQAADLKSDPVRPLLQGRTLALLFLNRSLRTRASFQIGAAQLGATAIVLEPGNGVWGIEFDSGMIMDGKAEEHVVEVAKVLSRYCDLIAMRAFPGFKNWQYDREEPTDQGARPACECSSHQHGDDHSSLPGAGAGDDPPGEDGPVEGKEAVPHLDMEPAASQHSGGQLGGDDRHEVRDECQPALSKSRVCPR